MLNSSSSDGAVWIGFQSPHLPRCKHTGHGAHHRRVFCLQTRFRESPTFHARKQQGRALVGSLDSGLSRMLLRLLHGIGRAWNSYSSHHPAPKTSKPFMYRSGVLDGDLNAQGHVKLRVWSRALKPDEPLSSDWTRIHESMENLNFDSPSGFALPAAAVLRRKAGFQMPGKSARGEDLVCRNYKTSTSCLLMRAVQRCIFAEGCIIAT